MTAHGSRDRTMGHASMWTRWVGWCLGAALLVPLRVSAQGGDVDPPAAAPTPTPEVYHGGHGQPPPRVNVVASNVRLRFVARQPNVTFHLLSGSSVGLAVGLERALLLHSHHYSAICTAPCEAMVPQGTHRMGLSRGSGLVVEAPKPVEVVGPAWVMGRYRSRAGIRVGGWVLFLGGTLAGAAMIPIGTISAVSDGFGPSRRGGRALLGVGAGLMIGSLIAGLLMVTRDDEATVEVVPR
jgi:hypothetical protein